MAKNEVFPYRHTRSLPVADGTVSGTPVKVGAFVGVTLTDRGAGGNAAGEATVALSGAYTVSTTDAVASVGLAVYITGAGAITTTASGNTLFGHSLGTKSAGAGTVAVEIHQV
ncbi:DUF2190 family protein [Kribbella deserti]|uniref:DUF2190 family protein n=1 Tax=Kribbella deserti TaxID=1926257 RepID=A0ABV6QGT6_9ACTN